MDAEGIPFTITCSMDVQALPFQPHMERAGCKNLMNAGGLSGVRSVRYRNEQKHWCRNQDEKTQSGTYRFRNAPVPDWDTECRNADDGGNCLDADAQLCEFCINFIPAETIF
jgi:hypothetical protein